MTTTNYPLLNFPLLAGLSPRHQSLILSTADDVSYVKRQRLFAEGTPARGCWLVQRGQIALDTAFPGRPPTVIQTLGTGQVVGWSWLVPPYRWRFGGVAMTPVQAVLLDTDRLRALANADAEFGQALALAMLRLVADRLTATRGTLFEQFRSARPVR